MKFKALKALYSGKFFSKDDNDNTKLEQFICIGQDGKLYEQVDFDQFVPFTTPLYDEDECEFDVESAIEKAVMDDNDFGEIASGENAGDEYIVILRTDGKAVLLIRGKNADGVDNWVPPRGNLEKWVGFITLPEGIEWA